MNSVQLESPRLRIGEMVVSESDSWDGRSGKMRSFKLLNNMFFIMLFVILNPPVLKTITSCYEMGFFNGPHL